MPLTFRQQSEARWRWTCIAREPVMDGYAESRFGVTFRLIPKPDRERLGLTEEGTDLLLRDATVDLHDIVAEDGTPLRFSPELVDALIGNPWTRRALINAWAESLSGAPSAAAAGN